MSVSDIHRAATRFLARATLPGSRPVDPESGPGEGAQVADADTVDAAILAAGDERPLKEIAAELAERFGMKRRDVYERALELREPDEDDDAC